MAILPVLDLVICHGEFLNADHEYMHANKSVKGFGSYGDLMIRDRKMYVVPSPSAWPRGCPSANPHPSRRCGSRKGIHHGRGFMYRHEATELIVGYSFNLQTNDLFPEKVPNPGAGREHAFHAWRFKGTVSNPVSMRAFRWRRANSKPRSNPRNNSVHLIETDAFPFQFLSRLGERESWRKEIHRPIYHVHKWWAKRLGSVFRGILLGSMLPEGGDLAAEFYKTHRFSKLTVFDPFMGSGTTIGEAHKLGFTAIGRDINPVAVESVRTALGPMDRSGLKAAFDGLSRTVGERIRALYRSKDSRGRPCDVLYHFWVMQVPCLECHKVVDLFPSWIIAETPIRTGSRKSRSSAPPAGTSSRASTVRRRRPAAPAARNSTPGMARREGPRPPAGTAATASRSWTRSLPPAHGPNSGSTASSC